MSLKIVIVDYDAGNLRNVQKAVEHAGAASIISNLHDEIKDSDVIILPGVGAFNDGMHNLKNLGLDTVLQSAVLEDKKPILGICLGIQLLSKEGDEGGQSKGLGILPMKVERLDSDEKGFRLPHIGWNEVFPKKDSILFQNVDTKPDFYFVHSYHVICEDETMVAATAHYGEDFVCAIEKDNVFATQFHPEKSQRYGLRVLKNFLNYCENYYKDR